MWWKKTFWNVYKSDEGSVHNPKCNSRRWDRAKGKYLQCTHSCGVHEIHGDCHDDDKDMEDVME